MVVLPTLPSVGAANQKKMSVVGSLMVSPAEIATKKGAHRSVVACSGGKACRGQALCNHCF